MLEILGKILGRKEEVKPSAVRAIRNNLMSFRQETLDFILQISSKHDDLDRLSYLALIPLIQFLFAVGSLVAEFDYEKIKAAHDALAKIAFDEEQD